MSTFFDILFKVEFLVGSISLIWLGFTVLVEKLRKIPRWAALIARKFNELYCGSREFSGRAAAESSLTRTGNPSMA